MGAAHGSSQPRSEGRPAGVAAVQRAGSSPLRDQGAPLKKTVVVLALLLAQGSSRLPRAIVEGQDATSVLREVDQALGASSLKSVRYSGTGFAYAFLQNPRPDVRYPKFYAKYTRAIDFEKGVSREETTRAQFENPPSGGGQQPLYTDTTGAAVTGESSAWGGGAVALT